MTDTRYIPPNPTANYCFVCGGAHPFKDCPSIQPPSPPAPPNMNPPEERPRSSLAPTQFEELFGEGNEGLLLDVLDRPDVFSKDQQELAMDILGGRRSMRSIEGEDRVNLDEIAHQIAFLKPVSTDASVARPAYVHTREEMEDF